jgi:hypothetical protein
MRLGILDADQGPGAEQKAICSQIKSAARSPSEASSPTCVNSFNDNSLIEVGTVFSSVRPKKRGEQTKGDKMLRENNTLPAPR